MCEFTNQAYTAQRHYSVNFDYLFRGLWESPVLLIRDWIIQQNNNLAHACQVVSFNERLTLPSTAIVVSACSDSKQASCETATNKANSDIFIQPYEGVTRKKIQPNNNNSNSNNNNNNILPSAENFDVLLNAGGPVWDIAFAPVFNAPLMNEASIYSSSCRDDVLFQRYLAVGTSRIGWVETTSDF
jgi:hypothetical protein